MASAANDQLPPSPGPEASLSSRTGTVGEGEVEVSPRVGGKATAVSFPGETISPLMIGKQKELDQKDCFDLDKSTRQYAASISGRRLSGRPSVERLGSYKGHSAGSNISLSSLLSEGSPEHHSHHAHERLVKHVTSWLKSERTRRSTRRAKRKANEGDVTHEESVAKEPVTEGSKQTVARPRSGSDSSDGSTALDRLASILEQTLSIKPADTKKRYAHVRKLSTGLKRHSIISMDSDYFDSVDQLVPNCEATLDNSKTMAYTNEEGDFINGEKTAKCEIEEKEAWDKFKYEILRIVHTLRLKGWRKVPAELSSEIDVQRLCGALTNAVYVVSPPKNLPSPEERPDGTRRSPPPKLLLRIYGPNVEHLIDRESELQILTRLARKRIGPCLLGTFTNGRFEEYLHAKALTAKDLRNPDTSKQIAKRMRELHEGIDLLKEEREAGPFVWQNWDKWINRCEQVVTWLDDQILEMDESSRRTAPEKWKRRGFVCGVEWPIFRRTVEKYRVWLEEQYGGREKLNERLVFAHNDTQYGNILRMIPEGESPLLLPANQHKQLVVIDFEYSNANLPGLEFANHFTEWTYNYHDYDYPWRCNASLYPTIEEQHRFICAYLQHTPSYRAPNASNPSTPHLGPLPTSSSSTALAATAAPGTISAFMLDSRGPPGAKDAYAEQEAHRDAAVEEEARRLMAETKLWRLANSAQWVAWGIVQAHVPELPDFDALTGETKDKSGSSTDAARAQTDGATTQFGASNTAATEPPGSNTNETTESTTAYAEQGPDDEFKATDEEEFDYLAYAQDRALFVWCDALRLGLVAREELPESVLRRVKVVEY